jgi:hypothetical protein
VEHLTALHRITASGVVTYIVYGVYSMGSTSQHGWRVQLLVWHVQWNLSRGLLSSSSINQLQGFRCHIGSGHSSNNHVCDNSDASQFHLQLNQHTAHD